MLKVKIQDEFEAKFIKAEFEATFDSSWDLNSSSVVDASEDQNCAFPVDLNPNFDMQAYFAVSTNPLDYKFWPYKFYTNVFSMELP